MFSNSEYGDFGRELRRPEDPAFRLAQDEACSEIAWPSRVSSDLAMSSRLGRSQPDLSSIRGDTVRGLPESMSRVRRWLHPEQSDACF